MPKFDRPPRDWPLRGDPARPVRPEPARQGNQMGTMAPIRPTVQRLRRISLTAGRPLGGLLEVLEVVCRPGGVRLAAGVPGGGVAGEVENEQRSRCADSSPRLLARRPAAVPGGLFVELRGARPRRPSFHHRGQPDVSAKVGEMTPTRREGGHDKSPRIRWHPPRPTPCAQGRNQHACTASSRGQRWRQPMDQLPLMCGDLPEGGERDAA